ncbi:DUF4383 domain-containing protein [Azospirillum sp. sgz302134]
MWWRNVTLIYAVAFTAVGILGFVPTFLSPPADGMTLAVESFHGRLLGLFPVNLLHNVVHLLFGLWAFFAYFSGRPASRAYLKSVAVIYAVFTVMGLIPGLNTLFGLVPLHGNDIWLHALLAIVAGYVGYAVHEPEADATRAEWHA